LIENSADDIALENQTFPGKIAIITDHLSISRDDYHSPDRLVAKYGYDKIIHITWPEDFLGEQDIMRETLVKLAVDREIRALIISQDLPGTNAAVDKFRDIRDDVFIVYSAIHEPPAEAVKRADLLFASNQLKMASAMVHQAKKQGAKVFVHYSFPRHMAVEISARRREVIRETCAAEGLKFIDALALDPTDEAGLKGAIGFILEDVPKLVAKHGEDTAFYCSNCHLQASLIKAVIDSHAIFPQPCCPSPFHGFPEALGIDLEECYADLTLLISEACRIAAEKNMTDRLSTWPVSTSMMFTNAGAEYAIKWIKGEVLKGYIDNLALEECIDSYITEVVGESCNVNIISCKEGGETYENYKLVLMSYLDL